ncbi:uncharacterized protein METZ01_LOCUS104579 [marine metagenome]|uniref:histidine--tRNA ligase n=1 Tax=marine metagenome TaxID=408172 RepID=A0A381WGU4_9ZZZZ
MSKIKSIRGMSDLTPSEVKIWQYVEDHLRSSFDSYGYQEVRFPLVEKSELFLTSVGTSTDIISKEMYSFKDKKGTDLALRPEGTAGCVRASLENDLLRVDSPRLWYMGPMFRYERPQKGRKRQFHQASVEAYGFKDHYIDAEMIFLSSSLWTTLGVQSEVELEINSLGDLESRNKYKSSLQKYFDPYLGDLDNDSKRILKENPLRILDSKSKDILEMLVEAPGVLKFVDKQSLKHFESLQDLLLKGNITFKVNEKLVRGLDYYNMLVFEWKTKKLGAQDTICGGGRYDNLVELLGGEPCPAVGFSIGLERLILLIEEINNEKVFSKPDVDCFFICLEEKGFEQAILVSEEIRKNVPNLSIKVNLEATSAGSQFKRADKSGAKVALILGAQEIEENKISLKELRNGSIQKSYSLEELILKLKKVLKK